MFEALKKAFITALDLTHCILDTAIPVETHTSDNPPTSASISTPNTSCTIAFHLQTLSTMELNYEVL